MLCKHNPHRVCLLRSYILSKRINITSFIFIYSYMPHPQVHHIYVCLLCSYVNIAYMVQLSAWSYICTPTRPSHVSIHNFTARRVCIAHRPYRNKMFVCLWSSNYVIQLILHYHLLITFCLRIPTTVQNNIARFSAITLHHQSPRTAASYSSRTNCLPNCSLTSQPSTD